MAVRAKGPPRGQVFEIDSGERTGAEVGDLHLWLIISGSDIYRDGIVIGIPLTGQDHKRTAYDVSFRPDNITALRQPINMKLKADGMCYALTSKPRHFSVQRLPPTPYGTMSEHVIHDALQRMGSGVNVNLTHY